MWDDSDVWNWYPIQKKCVFPKKQVHEVQKWGCLSKNVQNVQTVFLLKNVKNDEKCLKCSKCLKMF